MIFKMLLRVGERETRVKWVKNVYPATVELSASN